MFIRLTNRTREQTLAVMQVQALYAAATVALSDHQTTAEKRALLQLAARALFDLADEAQRAGLRGIQLTRLLEEQPILRELQAALPGASKAAANSEVGVAAASGTSR